MFGNLSHSGYAPVDSLCVPSVESTPQRELQPWPILCSSIAEYLEVYSAYPYTRWFLVNEDPPPPTP